MNLKKVLSRSHFIMTSQTNHDVNIIVSRHCIPYFYCTTVKLDTLPTFSLVEYFISSYSVYLCLLEERNAHLSRNGDYIACKVHYYLG